MSDPTMETGDTQLPSSAALTLLQEGYGREAVLVVPLDIKSPWFPPGGSSAGPDVCEVQNKFNISVAMAN